MSLPDDSASPQADLSSADYDPVTHLNAIFSHPSTLSSATTVSQALQAHDAKLNQSIEALAATRASADNISLQRMRDAQVELAELFKRIDSVRERAMETEKTITEMTADIKRLDGTKKNLTSSMTALKRLQMLTNAYEQLRGLSKTRQYRECAQLLGAVVQLMAYFKSYRSIDQIAILGRKVAETQRELLEQVCEDFEEAFARKDVPQKKGVLMEGCIIMDAMGENAKARLITWYCNASLREYRQIFRGSEEAGSLDNISRRYAWFNRMLQTYDHQHAAIFPPHWRVNEMLANAFCQSTREDFKGILQRSSKRADGQSLDVGLLLSCLQETLEFEHALERRFAQDVRRSIDTASSVDDRPAAFEQAISEAFEPYLSLWVEAQDKHLAALIPKYRSQPLRNEEDEYNTQLVLPSSTELFQVYRLDLAQCAKLSTGNRLLELSKTFGKYLDIYSQQVLYFSLAERFGPQGPNNENTVIILNTADYCYMTCNQLEEKIKARIDEEYKESVDLQGQADSLMGVAGAAVRTLVRKVEIECDQSWREMRNVPWARLESITNQSSYVMDLVRKMKLKSAEILRLLQHKQQYARAFCDQVVETLSNSFIASISQCRPITEAGAEQMLMDMYALRTAFTELPGIVTDAPQTPQPAYAKRVTQTMSKIDALLKTLQVRPQPSEALIQGYLVHIADSSEANFRTVLELKGLSRRQDQAPLLEIFNTQKATQSEGLSSSAAIFAHLPSTGQPPSSVSNTPAVSNLQAGKFDASSIGTALFNAARDGVDRMGSPVSHAAESVSSAIPSRMASPPGSSTPVFGGGLPHPPSLNPNDKNNLNDNLKNIGRFFKRDTSGFSRFGNKA
ncbi:MAG: hypothetical protein Q9162_006512 [Coniocarpon cinnabarinum]